MSDFCLPSPYHRKPPPVDILMSIGLPTPQRCRLAPFIYTIAKGRRQETPEADFWTEIGGPGDDAGIVRLGHLAIEKALEVHGHRPGRGVLRGDEERLRAGPAGQPNSGTRQPGSW